MSHVIIDAVTLKILLKNIFQQLKSVSPARNITYITTRDDVNEPLMHVPMYILRKTRLA